MSEDFMAKARLWPKGRLYEDFHEGQEFTHHWGRTVLESDTSLFTTLTLSYNPLYFNREYAKAHGHPDIVVNPQLVFNIIFGLTVQDCSEIGGPFLGVFGLTYHKPVYPGDTLYAHSVTRECRVSRGNPSNGIVTWATKGLNQRDELVVDFQRSNLVRKRQSAA
ncbi:MAG: dehydratase [Alphaproteobacteria bacterium HGW-Alphaproteobacteria-5]|nr:MAG: dehydratase [Alphaproteobacteria bacterium HGW-Alphaproteobacteria-5]